LKGIFGVAKKQVKPTKEWARRRNVVPVIIILAITMILAISYTLLSSEITTDGTTAQALLIDQLSITHPNKTFYWTTQELLSQSNLQLWYKEGIFNNVSFFRNLPSYNNKIIILRVHSAIDQEGNLAIFTGEKWDDNKARLNYLTDILAERIVKVRVEENSTPYFGITPDFIKWSMKGNFEDTTIIMMGCQGLTTRKAAEAFIEKGAKVYISWTGPVSSEHTDSATQHLLSQLFAEGRTVGEAVTSTNNEMGKDPFYGSSLAWYPEDEGNHIVKP